MITCGHDDHAGDHALVVINNDLKPMISGAKCQHGDERSYNLWRNSTISFGDSFISCVENFRDYKQYICHYDGIKPVFTPPPYNTMKLHAANQTAYYATVRAPFSSVVIRIDQHEKPTDMSRLSFIYGSSHTICMSASLDDSVMCSSQRLGANVDHHMYLTDISTNRDIRVKSSADRQCPRKLAAQSQYTWVASGCEDTSDLQIYDDRTPEWLTATYQVTKCVSIKLTSCVDNIALVSVYDFDLACGIINNDISNPIRICAFDIRNFDQYTLANLCPMASFIHLRI